MSSQSADLIRFLQEYPGTGTRTASFKSQVTYTTIPAPVSAPITVTEAYPTVVTSSGTLNSIANDLIQINYASRPSVVATGAAVVPAQAPSQVEETIYRSVNPPALAANEVVSVAGQTGLWTNKHEIESWRGDIPLSQYVIHNDATPQIVRKKPAQNVLYNQEIAVRYLNPPNPAPHGDIVIKEQPNIPTGPAPPIVLRQEPPRPVTPPALILREAPPRAPSPLPPKFLAIPGKRIPPPPRKVVVEKLPILPSKPQSIFIERWLPFKEQTRRVVFEKNTVPDPVVQIPKNVIVQWESPDVTVKKEFKDLGIVNADPIQYAQTFNAQLKTVQEFPEFVREIRPPQGVILNAEYRRPAVPRLVGDIQALNLIDLDRAGLSEYRGYVTSTSYVQVAPTTINISIDTLFNELFASVDVNADGLISVQEAERLLLKLNSRLGRSYGEDDVRLFFSALDVNRDGFISFDEFRRALHNHVVVVA